MVRTKHFPVRKRPPLKADCEVDRTCGLATHSCFYCQPHDRAPLFGMQRRAAGTRGSWQRNLLALAASKPIYSCDPAKTGCFRVSPGLREGRADGTNRG